MSMEDGSGEDGVDKLYNQLRFIELENEEVCLNINFLKEVVNKGKNVCW